MKPGPKPCARHEGRRGSKGQCLQCKKERQWRQRGMPIPTRPCPDACEACGKPPRRRALNADHDHETGEFRGWLCGCCNLALGFLGDNAVGVRKLLRYLEE